MNAVTTVTAEINLTPLRDFVTRFAALLDKTAEEEIILRDGATLLARLIAADHWLPTAFAMPHPTHYQQYLLHCDSAERFSVVSFVWGPGQQTPIHDHRVWGLVGVLSGIERVEQYERALDGSLRRTKDVIDYHEGAVAAVSPRIGDIHRVSNALIDTLSISIHVYGGNIGAVRRASYDADGTEKPFISGYANELLPNLWDRSGR